VALAHPYSNRMTAVSALESFLHGHWLAAAHDCIILLQHLSLASIMVLTVVLYSRAWEDEQS
jgi:hypothetical protein